MPVLRCAHGHEWEPPAADQAHRPRCPLCGSVPVDTLTPPAAPTYPPPRAGDSMETDETVVRAPAP
ncbi:MAG TPA: hypothetical protein VFW33_13945, partial [Gemmataceae bacterium]|nr:hypothetical protein [Gemmataceae bacterium]